MLNFVKHSHYAKRIGIMIVLGLGLSACSGAADLRGPFMMFKPDKPTTTAKQQNKLPAPKIFLSQTTGMPPGWSDRLHDHFTTEAGKKSVILSKSPESSEDLKLVGHFSAADIPKGTLVAYVWDLKDKEGKNLHRISGQKRLADKGPRGAWSAINNDTLRMVGEDAAANLQNWMLANGYKLDPTQIASAQTEEEKITKPQEQKITSASKQSKPLSTPRVKQPKQVAKKEEKTTKTVSAPLPAPKKQATFRQKSKPAESPRPNTVISQPLGAKPPVIKAVGLAPSSLVYVSAVNGATGQGNNELMRAIISSLAKSGLGISPSPSYAGYKLEGKVKIEPGSVGEDKVTLDWDIKTTDGTLIGTVAQKNNIKTGSLSQTWGQTALVAADAAAGKIKTVIDDQQKL